MHHDLGKKESGAAFKTCLEVRSRKVLEEEKLPGFTFSSRFMSRLPAKPCLTLKILSIASVNKTRGEIRFYYSNIHQC